MAFSGSQKTAPAEARRYVQREIIDHGYYRFGRSSSTNRPARI